MNIVVLIGNLSKDPELRYTGTGKAVATLTVAVNRGYGKDKDVDFLPVVVWEKQAESCDQYLQKGSKVGVQGSMQTRNYEAQDGSKRYITEVVARNVEFLSTKGKQEDKPRSAPTQKPQEDFNPDDVDLDKLAEFETMEDDEDLPF